MDDSGGWKLPRVFNLLKTWSGRRGSNPRRPAWEAGILPLNYSRPSAIPALSSFHDAYAIKTVSIQSP